MYYEYTQEQLRQYCRKYIESLESWARRLIHEKMVDEYGKDFVNKQLDDGNYLINSEIRKHIQCMLSGNPARFCREVDTLFIDQILYFLCHPLLYKKLFKPALDYIYPQGKEEAREFLGRLIPIRNPLSHSNPITMHDVERAICYSHDFIEGLKLYYKDRGEDQVWNVPRIIKIKDSSGNVFDNSGENTGIQSIYSIPNTMMCGDTYSVEIEMDSSFREDEYSIRWRFNNRDTSDSDNKTKFTVSFSTIDVSQKTFIFCEITSNKEWHKHRTYDDRIAIGITILPPQT